MCPWVQTNYKCICRELLVSFPSGRALTRRHLTDEYHDYSMYVRVVRGTPDGDVVNRVHLLTLYSPFKVTRFVRLTVPEDPRRVSTRWTPLSGELDVPTLVVSVSPPTVPATRVGPDVVLRLPVLLWTPSFLSVSVDPDPSPRSSPEVRGPTGWESPGVTPEVDRTSLRGRLPRTGVRGGFHSEGSFDPHPTTTHPDREKVSGTTRVLVGVHRRVKSRSRSRRCLVFLTLLALLFSPSSTPSVNG